MINLLPPDIKSSYTYARRNVVMRRWIVMFLVALVGLGAIATYGLLSIQQATVKTNKEIVAKEQIFKSQNYAQTQKQIQDISNSFKLAAKVLGQEVLFSKLLKQIAATIPANANLSTLNFSQSSTGMDISAVATDYATATQVQVNLADPSNKIFSKADIVSIKCDKSSTSDPNFPCTVNIRALFANDNPFLFISNKGAKT